MFSVDEMSYLWKVLSMKNVLNRWNVLSMKGSIYEKCSQSMKCLIYERFYLWNVILWKMFSVDEMYYLWKVLSMKCPIYEKCSQSMKCPIYEQSFSKMSKSKWIFSFNGKTTVSLISILGWDKQLEIWHFDLKYLCTMCTRTKYKLNIYLVTQE